MMNFMTTTTDHNLDWEQIIDCLDEFVEAWENTGQPPDLERFLVNLSDSQKQSGLIELIKIDLEYRWRDGHLGRYLENYADRHPSLLGENGDWPLDLIYEEFHIRKQLGDEITPQEYQERFPRHAGQLASLLKFESPEASTSLRQNYHQARFQPGQTIDDFDLLLLLGEGSFAQVFLARQISMQRLVALKISEAKGEEHKTLAQLDHPHIVRVFSQTVLEDRKLRLLYMQYHPGGTLKEVVDSMRQLPLGERHGQRFLAELDALLEDKGSPIPQQSLTRQTLAEFDWPQVVCWLGARLAEALDYAHQHDVLHRDLKPANVLLADDGAPKLADFNISFCKQVEGSNPLTYFGGSLAYMSPEQLAACDPSRPEQPEDLDGRSDLYSLGMILWELLRGKRPFPELAWALNGSQLLGEMIADRERGPDPNELPAELPPLLGDVLTRTLAPEKESRILSGAGLARQLELCIDPEVQRVLSEPCDGFRCAMLKFPTLTVLAVVTVCNAPMTFVNIYYNMDEIVKVNQQELFKLQVSILNAIAYGIGLSSVVVLMRPIRRFFRSPQNSPDDLKQKTRNRTLRLGYWFAGITLTLWLVCGILFPLGLHLKTGQSLLDDVHFLASHAINGSLAAAAIFFLISDFALEQLFPRVVNLREPDPVSYRVLKRLDKATHLILAGTICLPLVSVLLAFLLTTEHLEAFAVLALLGLLAVGCAYRWSLKIRRNSAALQTITAETGTKEQ